jgi:hypothetical protein
MEDSLMDDFCSMVIDKLKEYGYEIYNISPTSNEKEICIMTESMMIFVNDNDKSITISFEYTLDPEKVAQNMMILNEVQEVKLVYIAESYIFDPEQKKYIVGQKAKEVANKIETDKILREYTKDQVYSHILATQKCHEC